MPTQIEIATHLFMTDRSVREALPKIAGRLEINPDQSNWWQDETMDEIRRGFIEYQREIAAGRGGDDQFNLTRERARLTREQANKAARDNEIEELTKRDISVLTEVLAQMSTKIASKLEAIPVRIKREASEVPRDVMEIIEKIIVDVRNIAFSIELDWEGFDEMEEATRSGESWDGAVESSETTSPVPVG